MLSAGPGIAESDENCKKFLEKTMPDAFSKVGPLSIANTPCILWMYMCVMCAGCNLDTCTCNYCITDFPSILYSFAVPHTLTL